MLSSVATSSNYIRYEKWPDKYITRQWMYGACTCVLRQIANVLINYTLLYRIKLRVNGLTCLMTNLKTALFILFTQLLKKLTL